MADLKYYVYAYLREDGTPYYIGKGKGYRAFDYKRHRVKVPNIERIVLCEINLTEIGSFAIERRLIRWYGRKDLGSGILRNLTDGGEGGALSEETKSKMSESHKGEKHHMWGKTHSDKTKLKISATNKGRFTGNTNPFYGRTHSDEVKMKLSKTHKNKIISQETRKKISDVHKGRIVSDETRKKMSESRKIWWNR